MMAVVTWCSLSSRAGLVVLARTQFPWLLVSNIKLTFNVTLLAIFATSHLGAGMNIDYPQFKNKGNKEKQLVRYTALRLEGNCSQLEAEADAIESQSDCVQNFKGASCPTMPSCTWMVMATDILW